MESSKRNILLGVILLIMIIGGLVYAKYLSPKPEENELPKIKIGYNIQSMDTVPLMIAYEKGYFEDSGIDVELVQVTGSEGAIAIGAGQVDIVIISSARLFGPIEKGVPVKILSPMSNTDFELFVRPDSGIKTFKDLEGKKFSYGVGGGAKELFTRYILDKEGVDIEKIEFVDVDNIYLPVALMDQKTIDAALIADSNYVDQAKEMGGVILPVWVEKNYEKSPTGLVVAANSDYLNGNEDTIKSFFEAIIEANKYLKSDLDESSIIATDFMRENTNGAMNIKSEDFKNLVETGRVSYVLWEGTAVVVDLARVTYEVGNIEKELTVNDLYDLRFKNLLESAQDEIYGSN
ncbi:MAG: aliphatic sulfonates family abc transporter, periplasmic ligand-binding protein, NitT/TauT family transport system substrate-binding protein [candidate division WS6 bacterium GW2011_GWC1_33_20]|uniref:Aliphatic sulfonates family abc transporter, periplasmic ligand-binding protein, NitT/TauT family transport system substrate-binding protein n=1 Tax=candidate division WS6 bacterium GW2011_GWC1_33_20 TaxID=1619089 RepID=A0A0G0CK28_9BACT|nr:MAG: aliphatic sulfonates family abc transporter, periplasmic ligand-binding protein, NitT/TauT family transport system substrate-binding protein [candidate division WS6 bacterium GW2011_GWC1_33_20]